MKEEWIKQKGIGKRLMSIVNVQWANLPTVKTVLDAKTVIIQKGETGNMGKIVVAYMFFVACVLIGVIVGLSV